MIQEWLDNDQDGTGDNADPDDDNDGYLDEDEIACQSDPLTEESLPEDLDRDYIADCLDDDLDNDGCLNDQDAFPKILKNASTPIRWHWKCLGSG